MSVMLTLGRASKLIGVPKTTLARAIKAGKLPAVHNDDGSYQIDPAELRRVYATVRPKTFPPVKGSVLRLVHAALGQVMALSLDKLLTNGGLTLTMTDGSSRVIPLDMPAAEVARVALTEHYVARLAALGLHVDRGS